MEGTNNDRTSTDPPTTPVERQMKVITTSIQQLAWEMTRQNKELWQAFRKEPPTPPLPIDDNQPPSQREGMGEDQEADTRQMTHGNQEYEEAQKTLSPAKHKVESAGSSTHPSQHRPARSIRSSRRLDQSVWSSRGPDDKTARLEKELHEMKKKIGDMKNSLKAKAARNLDNLVIEQIQPSSPR